VPHFRWKPVELLIATLLLASRPGPVPAEEIAAPPPLFGKHEIHYSNLAQFTRWTDLLARWNAEREDAAESCIAADSATTPCAPPEWIDLVERLRGLPLRRQLEAATMRSMRIPMSRPRRTGAIRRIGRRRSNSCARTADRRSRAFIATGKDMIWLNVRSFVATSRCRFRRT